MFKLPHPPRVPPHPFEAAADTTPQPFLITKLVSWQEPGEICSRCNRPRADPVHISTDRPIQVDPEPTDWG